MSVTYVPLAELLPYARNSRTHDEVQVAQIAASIREFGFTNPILISPDKDIIAGHGRALAASRLGLETVPCIILRDLSKTQRRAYVILDNRLPLNAGWDMKILELELQELQAQEFELGLLGFDESELEALLNPEKEPAEGNTDPDETPEHVQTRCKPGDLWVLGRHRLLCGDSTDVLQLDRLTAGQKVGMVLTDPPYGISLDTKYGKGRERADIPDGRKVRRNNYRPIEGDDRPFDPAFILEYFSKAREIFLFGGNYFGLGSPENSWVCWDKKTTENADKSAIGDFELCWSRERHKNTMIRCAWYGPFGHVKKDDGPNRVHPTQKPVRLLTAFLERWGNDDDGVVDLFGGSGSTLIACEKTGRRCYMMELDPAYCDVILARWEAFTGLEAVRDDD